MLLTAARELLNEAIALAEQHHDPQMLPLAHALPPEDELLNEAPETAYHRPMPLMHTPGEHHPHVAGYLPLLAWAALEIGNEHIAERWVAENLTRTRSSNYKLYSVAGAWAANRWPARGSATTLGAAEEALSEALSWARAVGAPYVEAKALYVCAMLEAARRKVARSCQQYEQEKLSASGSARCPTCNASSEHDPNQATDRTVSLKCCFAAGISVLPRILSYGIWPGYCHLRSLLLTDVALCGRNRNQPKDSGEIRITSLEL